MVLEQTAWVFRDKIYTKLKDFIEEVHQYQIDIAGSDDAWQPLEVVIENPRIEIQYEAWLRKRRELLANERMAKDYADLFDDELDQEEGEEGVIILTLEADNKTSFTAGELLMKINNALANKDLGDYVFFEGLDNADSESTLPAYFLYLGS